MSIKFIENEETTRAVGELRRRVYQEVDTGTQEGLKKILDHFRMIGIVTMSHPETNRSVLGRALERDLHIAKLLLERGFIAKREEREEILEQLNENLKRINFRYAERYVSWDELKIILERQELLEDIILLNNKNLSRLKRK